MTSQNNHNSSLLKDAGYSMYHAYRKDQQGGGVAIIAKNSFIPKNGNSPSYKTFEAHIQNLKIFKASKPVTLVIIYRLCEGSKTDFINEFYSFTEFLTTNYSNILMCGDFNIHINKPNEKISMDFNDILNTFSLTQSVHEPTHVCGNTLDLIIHDPAFLDISNIYIEQPDRSDHSLVFFQMECNLHSSGKREISFRNFKNVDHAVFKRDIESSLNNFLLNCNESNFAESVSLFNTVVGKVVDFHAPIVTKYVESNPKPGWIDQEFKTARSERRKLYKIWKRTKNNVDRNNFELSRSQVNNISISKRRTYLTNCIAGSNNKQRELFKICNSLLDVQKCRSLPDCEDSTLLANNFNEHFVRKIVNIRENMSSVSVDNIYVNKLSYGIGEVTCARSTLSEFSQITEDELKKNILSRKIKTSAEDVLPAQLILSCLDQILPALVKLVNISLATGSMQGLKDSVITPLFKKHGLDPEKLSSYRPVNNILYLSKLIEDEVSRQLKSHMDENNLHISNQSAYKSSHSCETLLLKLTDDILKAMDSGRCVITVLMDLSSAFDTVDHDRLKIQLHNEIGLRDVALRWFSSYLTDRHQAVSINGHSSEYFDMPYGVPQGSVVGPILFNIYVRNFIKLLNDSGFLAHGYADDHQAYKYFGIEFQYESICCSVPRILDIIGQWMKASFLKLNSSKSQVIIFAPDNLADNIHIDNIKLSDGCVIPVSTMVNNLGICFDSRLSFAPQVNSICSYSYKLLRNLASVRKFLSTDDLRLLVQSIVVSRIDNCNSLLYGVLVLHINKLQKLQNACARLIYGKRKREHVTPLLHELHWLPIRRRIIF